MEKKLCLKKIFVPTTKIKKTTFTFAINLSRIQFFCALIRLAEHKMYYIIDVIYMHILNARTDTQILHNFNDFFLSHFVNGIHWKLSVI